MKTANAAAPATDTIVSPLFHGNAVPWHGLAMTINVPFLKTETALFETGKDALVGRRNCCMVAPDGTIIKIEEAKVMYFIGTNKTIKVVGNRYKPTQNVDAFKFMDSFIFAKKASIEIVGGLKDGNIVWMMADASVSVTEDVPGEDIPGEDIPGFRVTQPIPSVEIVPGDEVKAYIHLSHSHDGTLSIRAGFTPVRMANMSFLSLDRDMASNNIVKTKHTVGIDFSIEAVNSIMETANADFAVMTARFKKFAALKMTKHQALAYFKKVMTGANAEKDIEKTLDNLMFLWENSDTIKLAGHNLWGAYNVITEFNTWYRGRSADTRLQSLWFGQYGENNRHALEAATKMVEG